LKTRYALDASTVLNWSDDRDRVLISENLRANAEVLAAEILLANSHAVRASMLADLQRVYTRLAVCDMDAARKVERRLDLEKQRDSLCRITLEKMADCAYEAAIPDRDLARNYLVMMQMFARVIRDEKLTDWYTTGPYSGLGCFALTVSEIDVDKAMKEREAFNAICDMATVISISE